MDRFSLTDGQWEEMQPFDLGTPATSRHLTRLHTNNGHGTLGWTERRYRRGPPKVRYQRAFPVRSAQSVL